MAEEEKTKNNAKGHRERVRKIYQGRDYPKSLVNICG